MATVPVNDTTPRNQYTAAGSQTIFDYDFIIFAEADLEVYVDGTLQTLTTHYTITDVLDPDGGTVVFVTPMTGGEVVVIQGEIAIERLTDFQPGGQFDPEDLNTEQDKQIAMMKQIKRDEGFHVTFDTTVTTTTANAGIMPEPVDDATFAFDGTTGAFKIGPTTAAITAAAGDAADAAASAAAALVSENAAAASASAASTSETNAATSETNAGTSETNAAASAAAADVAKIEWQGTYNAGTAYVLNDAVTYLGSSFINIQAGTGQTPVVGGTAYWDDLAIKGTDGAGSLTSITAGTGLDGGTITTSGTIDIADTAVTPGSYTTADITVDQQGRITAASTGSIELDDLSDVDTTGAVSGDTLEFDGSDWNAVTPSSSDPQQLCKAWCHFRGSSTVAIYDSFNVSSVTDLGVGLYRVNYTTSMASTSYVVNTTAPMYQSGNANPTAQVRNSGATVGNATGQVASYVEVAYCWSTIAFYDPNDYYVTVFGDQ